MRWIWTCFLFLSIVSALFTGRTAELSKAILEGAQSGVTLAISLAGPLCLWSGLSAVIAGTSLSRQMTQASAPLLRRLFPQAWQIPKAREALCGNFAANLLGLGSAATPMGIQAARAMAQDADGQASRELCRLIVMNTASIQLLPTTVAAVRSGLGASSPFDILPAVWIASVCSVTVGLLTAKVLDLWIP